MNEWINFEKINYFETQYERHDHKEIPTNNARKQGRNEAKLIK